MAQLPQAFNAKEHDDMNDFSVMPEGDYVGSIIKSELILTKNAKQANDPSLGQMLKMQVRILAGKHKGKIVFVQLNIVNPNPTAVEIANKELGTICRACKTNGPIADSTELHGIPMKIKIGIESSPNYPDKNKILMYEASDGSIPLETAASESAKESPENGSKKRPWE